MKKFLFPVFIILVMFIVSCRAAPTAVEAPPARPPVRPPVPEIPTYIMGMGRMQAEQMSSFLLNINPGADTAFVENLVLIYIEEAAIEGVNHDTAFAQMCLETGYLRFGNLVVPEQYNFAGLGAIGPGQPGLSFPDPRIGVRAHIQHLKAYGSIEPLEQELVNPRYRFVRRGSSPTISGLAGTWAADPRYAEKIYDILEKLYDYAYNIL